MAQTEFNGDQDQTAQQKESPTLNGMASLSSGERREASLRERERKRATPQRSRLLLLFTGLAALLVVGLIVAGALLLFVHRSPNAGSAPTPIVSTHIPFQPLPSGCFIIPFQQDQCPHDPFTPVKLSKDIAGHTITITRAYADANQVLIENIVTRDADHRSIFADLSSTLRTQQGITLFGNGGGGASDAKGNAVAYLSFEFEPATMPSENTSTLSLHLIITGIDFNDPSTTPLSLAGNPVTFDFSLPFHPSRAIILHKTVTVAGTSVMLEQMVATPSATRFYLQVKLAMLDQNPAALFSLTVNGRGVSELVYALKGFTGQGGSTIASVMLNFASLSDNPAVCVLTVKAPAGQHAGPWIFHFTVQ